MSRIPALLAALTGLAGALAAPALKDRRADRLYAPTCVGDRQVYEQRGPNGTTEGAHVVAKVEEKDGALRVTIQRDGETSVWTDMVVSEKGVVWHTLRGFKLDYPVPAVKLPLKPGESWEYEPKSGHFKRTYTVGREEEVDVPAGKFRAIRVEEEFTRGDERQRHTFWHAPRVGIVKAVIRTETAEWTQVLTSFTPGDAPVLKSPAAGKK
jgi:hypothetical protein